MFHLVLRFPGDVSTRCKVAPVTPDPDVLGTSEHMFIVKVLLWSSVTGCSRALWSSVHGKACSRPICSHHARSSLP